MQTARQMLGAVTVALLVLCAAWTRGAEAGRHRPHAAKHATAKHAGVKQPKTKRPTAARQAKSAGAAARHSADEPAEEAGADQETKPQRASETEGDANDDHVRAKPATHGGPVSQAADSEDPPMRQRVK